MGLLKYDKADKRDNLSIKDLRKHTEEMQDAFIQKRRVTDSSGQAAQSAARGGEKEMIEGKGFWQRLEENHPVLYEVIQWGILVLAVLALIFS